MGWNGRCGNENRQALQRREIIGQALLAMSLGFALRARSATETGSCFILLLPCFIASSVEILYLFCLCHMYQKFNLVRLFV